MPGVKGAKSPEHIAKLRMFLKEHNKRLGEIKRGIKRPEVSGEKAGQWKGGRYKDHRGYIRVFRPDHPHCNIKRYVYEHRLVYEESRNCCLLPWIVVHHIDGNRSNNIWYNLRSMTNEDHVSMEQKKKKLEKLSTIG